MTLRARIISIMAAGLLLIAIALLGTGWAREQLQQERLETVAHAAQKSLWAEILATEDQELDQGLDKLALDKNFLLAAKASDKKAITKALIQLDLYPGEGQKLDLLAVMRPGQEPLSLGADIPHPLLDSSSVDLLLAGESTTGLRTDSGASALVLSARLLPGDSDPIIVVSGRHVKSALQRLSARSAAAASVLDLRGQLIATTDDNLWAPIAPLIAPRLEQYFQHDLGRKTYTVTSIQVHDLVGHDVGALVLMRDQTEEAHAVRFLDRLALAITLFLIISGLLGLSWYLRHSFKPLERAITALQALAKGDTSVRLLHTRNDEIGRIAQAVATFRRNAQDLAHARSQRERVRRRQQRLIHTQLQQLADATDMTSREEVMQLLNESTPLGSPEQRGEDDQLRQLAMVMSDLSQRIVEQHQSLTSMVIELREALVTKTRLAGLQQELQVAAEVQRGILPPPVFMREHVKLHCHITPAREVGGDFYDYFMIDKEHLGLVMADVSGKGVPAAIFMAITRTLLRATALFVTSPSSCMRRLNDLLAAENEQMMFVTVFYGVLHLPSGTLRYVNAGHNPPYLLTANGNVQTLPRTAGVAVAVSEDFVYKEAAIQLNSGDKLLLFTDGVTEAFNPADQAFGEERLEAVLRAQDPHHTDCEALTQAVLDAVHDFEDGAQQADDITCMSVLYNASTTSYEI